MNRNYLPPGLTAAHQGVGGGGGGGGNGGVGVVSGKSLGGQSPPHYPSSLAISSQMPSTGSPSSLSSPMPSTCPSSQVSHQQHVAINSVVPSAPPSSNSSLRRYAHGASGRVTKLSPVPEVGKLLALTVFL